MNALSDSVKSLLSGSTIFSISYLYKIRNKFGLILDSDNNEDTEKSINSFIKQNNKNYFLFIPNKCFKNKNKENNIYLHSDFKDLVLEFPKFDIVKIIN